MSVEKKNMAPVPVYAVKKTPAKAVALAARELPLVDEKYELIESIRKLKKKIAQGRDLSFSEKSIFKEKSRRLRILLKSEMVLRGGSITEELRKKLARLFSELTDVAVVANSERGLSFESDLKPRDSERLIIIADDLLQKKRDSREGLKDDHVLRLGQDMRDKEGNRVPVALLGRWLNEAVEYARAVLEGRKSA